MHFAESKRFVNVFRILLLYYSVVYVFFFLKVAKFKIQWTTFERKSVYGTDKTAWPSAWTDNGLDYTILTILTC